MVGYGSSPNKRICCCLITGVKNIEDITRWSEEFHEFNKFPILFTRLKS